MLESVYKGGIDALGNYDLLKLGKKVFVKPRNYILCISLSHKIE